MNIITIPYGRAGWVEKIRIVEDIVSSRPSHPSIYNDILIIVPSSRLKRTYGRLFLEAVGRVHGAAALVQPEVRTLHEFLHHLYAAQGGPALMDETSRLVLVEGLVKEHMNEAPGFGVSAPFLAPSLSAAAADMIEDLSSAGVPAELLAAAAGRSEFGDKPTVRLLVDVYTRYEDALDGRNLTDPAGMAALLEAGFDQSRLGQYRLIIVDGIHDAKERQIRLLRRITAAGNVTMLIDAPSPGHVRSAGEHHPLRMVREFIAALGAPAVSSPVPAAPETIRLADVLFSDKPFHESAAAAPPPGAADIRTLSAVNMREEVSLIAGSVKSAIASGTPSDSILVAFPSLDEYGPLAEEIFRDYGLPYNRALGRQLSTSPVATAVIALLTAVRDGYTAASMLRVFTSPFLKFGGTPALSSALDRLMRDRRIIAGKERWLRAAARHGSTENEEDFLSGPLNDLFSGLEPFETEESLPLTVWMERLSSLLSWSGLAERVAAIKGPLSVNLQAHRKLLETTASLGRAGRLFPGYRYTFVEWLFLLKKTFFHARFQVPPDDEGGVQILGFEESASHLWNEVYLGGLIDGKFPQRRPQNIFLPEATLEEFGVRTLEKARSAAAYHFYRLVLSAPRVTLTWPENRADRPVVPSPLLAELTPLRIAGLLNRGVEKTSGIQFRLRVEESRSVPELAKALALAGDVTGLEGILGSDIDGMKGINEAVAFRPVEAGQTITVPPVRTFAVTELDEYLNCPYDYYVKHILKIEPLEEVTEDITALDRGSKVHGILKRFYEQWQGPVTAENRAKAARLLSSLADRAFDREADTFRNRREKDRFRDIMAERFLDAEVEFWTLGMRPMYLEHRIEPFSLRLADGRAVELRATIDRIDADEQGNFIIVDYKTGKYPLPKTGVEQDIFQLPLYAVMAQAVGTQGELPLRRAVGLAYYDLSGRFGGPARDVVLYDRDTGGVLPAGKPKSSPKSSAEFEAILKLSLEKARRAAEGILAGDFPAGPGDEGRCRSCANGILCGYDHE